MKKLIGMILLVVTGVAGARAEETAVAVATPLLERMRERVEMERAKEEGLQLLQLDVERLKLELEKKKAVLALSAFSGGGETGKIQEQPGGGMVVHVRYVFIAGGRKEAMVDIDGVRRRWIEGETWGGKTLKSVTEKGIVIADGGKESFAGME